MSADTVTSSSAVEVLPAPAAQLLIWHVAPEHEQRFAIWLDCQHRWLNALERRSGGPNTRRAYARDVTSFFLAYQVQNLMPWQVSRVHVAHWVEQLVVDGLGEATINRKLAALSSLYEYASQEYVLTTEEGERALWEHPNPFRSKSLRFRVEPYGRSVFPSTDQVRQLFLQLDLTTLTGLRNLAILAGMFATTRRVNEWIGLRWGDLHEGPTGYWFRYRYKGGREKKQAIPSDIWNIIEAYLKQSGRWGQLGPDDAVFIAHSEAAIRFVPAYVPGGHLSASYVNQLLKRYGRRAGIPDELLHAHALRHAGARYRRERGADVFELRDLLGHKSIGTTQIYTETALNTPTDERGEAIVRDILPQQLKFLLH